MKKGKKAQFLIITLVIMSAFIAGYTYLSSANAVDKLTIKIGYFGWPTSDYVEKAVFKASDLYDMGPVNSYYTYWDGSKRVAIDSSFGVPLTTIIDAAGIDQSSISNLDFWTADSGNGAFASFTWKQLIGTKRYYFADLASYFHYNDSGKIVCDTKEAWKHARRVQPMMALEENWTWYEIGTEDATGTDSLGTANRFRLNFGQADPTEKRTFNSAKMVHTIYVMFSGTPKLTSSESNIEGKVGSDHQLKVTAAAADEALDKVVQENIEWSSSDTRIVDVDDDGYLTFNSAGTATIYASSGGGIKKFTVTVTGDEEEEQEPEPEPEPKDEEDNDGGGKGSGNGDGKGNGSGNGTDTSNPGNTTKSETVVEEKVRIDRKKTNTFILSDEASKDLRLALNKQAPSEEASMSTHQNEMDKDTEQLKVHKDENNMGRTLGLINGLLFAQGSVFGLLRYRKQRWK